VPQLGGRGPPVRADAHVSSPRKRPGSRGLRRRPRERGRAPGLVRAPWHVRRDDRRTAVRDGDLRRGARAQEPGDAPGGGGTCRRGGRGGGADRHATREPPRRAPRALRRPHAGPARDA
jgi:hypothetical protein